VLNADPSKVVHCPEKGSETLVLNALSCRRSDTAEDATDTPPCGPAPRRDFHLEEHSQGGLGGCPCASGASGNIVTEDLVFPLEVMGFKTGIDIDRLIAARTIISEGLPGVALYGNVHEVGLPKGFRCASSARKIQRRFALAKEHIHSRTARDESF